MRSLRTRVYVFEKENKLSKNTGVKPEKGKKHKILNSKSSSMTHNSRPVAFFVFTRNSSSYYNGTYDHALIKRSFASLARLSTSLSSLSSLRNEMEFTMFGNINSVNQCCVANDCNSLSQKKKFIIIIIIVITRRNCASTDECVYVHYRM